MDHEKMEDAKVKAERVKGVRGSTKVIAAMGVVVSVVYLMNFSFGVFEVPDYFPIIGHVDEVAACAVLFSCLGYLGIRLPGMRG